MGDRSKSAMEFYRQLALLLQSGMPLPESIRSLEPGLNSRAFREATDQLAASVDSGKKLSEAMHDFPDFFRKQYVEMIEIGEDSGTLAETMAEIGHAAYIDHKIIKLVRDIVFYPLLVILVLIGAIIGLSYAVVYPMYADYIGIMDGVNEMRSLIFDFSVIVREYLPFFIAGYLLLVALGWYFLSGRGKTTAVMLALLRYILGFDGIFIELANARLCMFWGMMMKRGMTEKQILPLLCQCIDNWWVRGELKAINQQIQAGTPVMEALDKTQHIPRTIRLIFRHAPENRIPGELESLSQLYMEQATAKLRKTAVGWEAALTILVSIGILLFIMAMLAPLRNLIHID